VRQAFGGKAAERRLAPARQRIAGACRRVGGERLRQGLLGRGRTSALI